MVWKMSGAGGRSALICLRKAQDTEETRDFGSIRKGEPGHGGAFHRPAAQVNLNATTP
jgi:hypothetical protein